MWYCLRCDSLFNGPGPKHQRAERPCPGPVVRINVSTCNVTPSPALMEALLTATQRVARKLYGDAAVERAKQAWRPKQLDERLTERVN